VNAGDRVIFVPGPSYPEELERQILDGETFTLTSLPDELGIAEVEAEGTGWIFTVHRDWLRPAVPPLPKVTCVCDLTVGGCVCGAMDIEMKHKGYRRNPVTKLWERIK
jgi:hypothetical protein